VIQIDGGIPEDKMKEIYEIVQAKLNEDG